jgi:hypothetical protein
MGYFGGGPPPPPFFAQSLRNRYFMLGLVRGVGTCPEQRGVAGERFCQPSVVGQSAKDVGRAFSLATPTFLFVGFALFWYKTRCWSCRTFTTVYLCAPF